MSNENNIFITTPNTSGNISITKDASQYYANLAKEYALSAQRSAIDSQNSANSAENSKNNILNNEGFEAVSNDLMDEDTIGICAENIEAILDAPTQAQIATQQAQIATQKAQDAQESAETAAELLDSKADKTNTLNHTQITNCILELPQMVDLSLANGVLTLKANSKVIVPYGKEPPELNIGDSLNGGIISDISWNSAKEELFYIVQYNTDKTSGNVSGSVSDNRFCIIRSSGAMSCPRTVDIFSGETAPTSRQSMLWYDTANNFVKRTSDYGATWSDSTSLPFALIYLTNGVGVTSIEQTFQSIGYIGSTVWANMGIKGLVPNGRNEDGTLKNNEFTSSKIITRNFSGTFDPLYICLVNNNTLSGSRGEFAVNNDNYLIDTYANGLKPNAFSLCSIKMASDVINSIDVKQPFRAVDYNDYSKKIERLNEVGNTKLNKSQITNCILEMPKMVDLELAEGALSLKTGSKVIVPYGTSAPTMAIGDSLNGGTIVDISWDNSKLFYIVQYNSNIVRDFSIFNLTNYFVVVFNGGFTGGINFVSGNTDTGTGSHFWYDTANNIMKYYDNSTSSYLYSGQSLPIAICDFNSSSNAFKINEIFQSIGYIGSTIWANKGIKGLIPNGRNEDGSLNNIEYITPYIRIREFTTNYNADNYLQLNESGLAGVDSKRYEEVNSLPDYTSLVGWNVYLNNSDNYMWISGYNSSGTINSPWQIQKSMILGRFTCQNDKVISLEPKNTFKALDNSNIKAYVVDAYVSSISGYRIYSDGFCEQWGKSTTNSTVTLLKAFANVNYNITLGLNTRTGNVEPPCAINLTTNSFQLFFGDTAYAHSVYWCAKGFIN